VPPGVAVRAGRPEDAPAVAAIHAERISEGFLVTLGQPFLVRLYRRIGLSPGGVLVVVERDGSVVGFAAGAVDTRRLYREFLRHDALRAGMSAAPALLRSPRRVWETLRYGTTPPADGLPQAEILSIAVTSGYEGQGIGGAALAAAVTELVALGASAVQVVTTVGNTAAITMYERGGFERGPTTEVHRGVTQQVLVWR
jgi:ribosomal protein S18 acetylase RimI-like enzyme